MRKLMLAGAFAAIFAVSPALAQANPGDATPGKPEGGAKTMQNIEPGKVGPGSEKNSQVSPTSPSIPTHNQPPPEIYAPPASGSAGSSNGEEGKSAPTSPPPAGVK